MEPVALPPSLDTAQATPVSQRIAILDCGAQYTKVIDRRIRELNVETEIRPSSVDAQELKGVAGIIISGGPHSVYEAGAPKVDEAIFELGVPVLGICYGMQVLSRHFGGDVVGTHAHEYGETTIEVNTTCPLFTGMAGEQQVLMSHGDSVTNLGPGFEVVGVSKKDPSAPPVTAAIANVERRVYGLQFHPEVELTENGATMLKHFLFEVCEVSGAFTLDNRLEQTLDALRHQIGHHPVFVLVSGGVDSAVTAALLNKALGPEQVYAVHIDSGMMRHHESDGVMEALEGVGLKNLKRVNAEADFLQGHTDKKDSAGNVVGQLGPLCEITDPEVKRQIIGDVFFHIINKEMQEALQKLGASDQGSADGLKVFLAQGTLRPDLIESGNRDISTTAHTIKTHHNDVDLIRRQRELGLVVEPNRDWHKDEVRQIGRMLGLPEEMVSRQPFPGPGLGIRVLCTQKPFGLDRYDEINGQLQAMTRDVGVDSVLVPVRSVGVQGDGRSYSYLAWLQPQDPATLGEADTWLKLRELVRQVPNRIRAINRLAVVLNGGPLPAEIKSVTPTHLNRPTLDKLRALDHQVTETFRQRNELAPISQLLTVLIPAHTHGEGFENRHSVAIRGVITSDFMTARAMVPGKDVSIKTVMELARTLPALDTEGGIDRVVVDITAKPPATVEWE